MILIVERIRFRGDCAEGFGQQVERGVCKVMLEAPGLR